MSKATKLSFIEAESPSELAIAVNSLPFRIEIKAIEGNRVWFVLGDSTPHVDLLQAVSKMPLELKIPEVGR